MRRLKVKMARSPVGLSCREMEAVIDAYLDKEMPLLSRLKFWLHVTLCGECLSYLHAYAEARRLTKLALQKESPEAESIPDDLVKAILAHRKSK